MSASILERHEHVRDPNLPTVPLGESKNEMLSLAIGIAVMAFIALAFWFEATH